MPDTPVDPKFQIQRPDRAAEMQQRRCDYMMHRITHEEYFLWLGEFIGLRPWHLWDCRFITPERVQASQDPYLNDIPLPLWDLKHETIRHLAAGLPWSLSDTVCVLKVYARKWAQESDNHPDRA